MHNMRDGSCRAVCARVGGACVFIGRCARSVHQLQQRAGLHTQHRARRPALWGGEERAHIRDLRVSVSRAHSILSPSLCAMTYAVTSLCCRARASMRAARGAHERGAITSDAESIIAFSYCPTAPLTITSAAVMSGINHSRGHLSRLKSRGEGKEGHKSIVTYTSAWTMGVECVLGHTK